MHPSAEDRPHVSLVWVTGPADEGCGIIDVAALLKAY